MQERRQGLGVLGREGGGHSFRLERTFDAPPELLWRALSEPAELSAWLADATLEHQIGGTVELRFDDGRMRGRITDFDPPRVLAYTWDEGDGRESHVRFELEAAHGGTRLTLLHTRLNDSSATGFAAGWHHHVERLAGHMAGTPVEWSWDRFNDLKPRYEEVAP